MISYSYLKQWIGKEIHVLGRYRDDEIKQVKETFEMINPNDNYIIEDEIVTGDINENIKRK